MPALGELDYPIELERELEIKPTRFGRSVLASYRPQRSLSNAQLLAMVPEDQQAKAWQSIEAAGINRRFLTPSIYLDGLTLETVYQNTSRIGSEILRRILKEQKWESVDRVVVTSLFLDESLNKRILAETGLDTDTPMLSYRTACAGFAAAFIDTLADSKRQNERTAILALEPLGALFHPKHFQDANIAIPAIFGDHYIGLGFTPADFSLIYAESHVIPDNGVIKGITFYDLPPNEAEKMPEHYHLATAEAAEIFSYSDRGAFMKLQQPEGDISYQMSGMKTAGFFKTHTPPILTRVYLTAQSLYPADYKIIFHNPSQPVVDLVNRALAKNWDYPYPLPQVPYMLKTIGASNSSSATTPDVWQYLIESGQLSADEPFIIGAPGIGSLITAGAVVPR